MNKILKRFLSSILVAVHLLLCCGTVFAVERVYILPTTTKAKAPKTNVFQLKGSSEKFILLDSTDEGYFVLSLKSLRLWL